MSGFELHPILEAGQAPRDGLWYVISPEDGSQVPSARVGACVNFLNTDSGGKILLSAGATPEGPYSDLHELRIGTDSYIWHSLSSKGLPPRYEHASFLAGSQLHLFGGAHESGPLNDLWRYEGVSGQWVAVPSTGPTPSPRTLHTSTSTGPGGTQSVLVVFSGGAAGSRPMEDTAVHLFDSSSSRWSLPPTSGTPPSPRQGHVSAVIGTQLFIHGGMAGQEIHADLHTLNLEKWVWSQPKVDGTPPPPLAAHGCAVIGERLYLFGGLTHGGASDILYCLDTANMQWREVPVSGAPPPSRLDHAMCSIMLPLREQKPTEATVLGMPDEPARNPQQETVSHGSCDQGMKEAPCGTLKEAGRQTVSFAAEHPPKPAAAAAISDFVELTSRCQSTTTSTTVTVISPEDLETQDIRVHSGSQPTSGSSEAVDVDTEATAEKVKQLHISQPEVAPQGTAFLSALFVFGGMDTGGTIHEDAFVIVPPH